jgi:hypothetical protein
VSNFITMVNRIAVELRRSNLTDNIKSAINDAIAEAAKLRFYFNEMHSSFVTVPGQEYYPDLSLVELDDAWYYVNNIVDGQKERIYVQGQLAANDYRIGNATGGQLESLSRYGGQLRLQPVPTSVVTIYLDGYGKLLPSPLVADADTNAWMTDGELYIRSLAKRNVLRDVVRDYGEATILESIAEDYKGQLIEDTTLRSATGSIRSTQF